ncbi:NAD(P) transhydrogenase subunit alpha [Gelatiniphilus marinus]|uniref:proton-translocating NAD(P)(+) transhydrogenase n=1 Tax=Gelatiniphilus marinus TaxID=1759464 RepID=A0ABW5JP21_9FLAO
MSEIIQFISNNLNMIYILAFAIFLGFEIISKVPTVLHTPLMSGSNAISGLILIGAILLIRVTPSDNYITLILGTLGIVFGSINAFGGFAVTGRMLEMFNKKRKK